MKFEEKVRDFLKVIDFDLCVVDEQGITIHDKCNEDSLNDVLEFPITFKSNDDLRAFSCNKSSKNYTMKIMNTQYHKNSFIKNGIDMFRLGWRSGVFSSKEADIFSTEIFHHDSLYISFIGKDLGENYVSYRKFKDSECIDVIYSIDSEKRKFEIIFNIDKKIKRKISINVPLKSRNQSTFLCVQDDKREFYRQELKGEEIENYMQSLFYKAGNIIMETHEGIQTLDSTIFDKVFDYYDIAKEFMNIMHNSKASNEVVNEIFKKYFDSAEFEFSDVWIERMSNSESNFDEPKLLEKIRQTD